MVVLAHAAMVAQHLASASDQAVGGASIPRLASASVLVHERGILRSRFTNGLAAERLFVAHLSRWRQLAKDARDDELRHLVAPDRPHHERGEQHVASEVRGVCRQSGHQLFARRQQLDPAHLPLEPPRPEAGAVSAGRGEELEELGAEDLLSGDRKSTRLNSSHGYISYA